MGFITLTGDSDGDLHTAALHNNKFGAIASVLNGNINKDNLAAPQSILNWSFGTGFGSAVFGTTGQVDTNVLRVASETGSIDVSGWGNLNSTNAHFMLLDSVKKAPAALRLVSVDAVVYQQNGTVADNYVLKLQKSSSVNGTYANMATGNFVLNSGASTITPASITMSVTDAALDQNEFFRAVFFVPATPGTYAPDYPQIHVNCTWKAFHVA
tara:strand:- start:9808 stop:10443 length:636 start_codon:yes stop_codon:yes gene_type:complete